MTTLRHSQRGLRQLRDDLRRLPRTLGAAQVHAANNLAFDVRAAEIDTIQRVFQQPVPFVRRSPKVDKATAQKPTASVYIDERVQDSLVAEVFGGRRVARDATTKLRLAGTVTQGEYVTYNSKYTNRAGNLTLATWRKILAETKKRNGAYFIAAIQAAGWSRPVKAIWQRGRGTTSRSRRRIKPIAFITDQPKYDPIFDFYGEATKAANRAGLRRANQALDFALRRAFRQR